MAINNTVTSQKPLSGSGLYLPPPVAQPSPKKLISGAAPVTPNVPNGHSFLDFMHQGGGSLAAPKASSALAGNVSLGAGGQVYGGVSNYQPPAPTAPPQPQKTAPPKKVVSSSMGVSRTSPQAPVKGLVSSTPAPVLAPMAPPQGQQTQAPLMVPPQPTPQPALSYGGLVGSLAGASSPNKTQTGLIQQSVDAAKGNRSIQGQAQDIANQYGQKIADVGGQGAKFQAGQLTTGTSPVAEGNAAITAQSTAAQQQALASGEAAALEGVGYQLTGQGQLQSGLNNALGGANTQQGQQLTGLNEAAGRAQPSGTYPFVFNPLSGDFKTSAGGNNLDPNTAAQGLAQKVLSGQMSYGDAAAALGYAGGVGTQLLNSAIGQINPNANLNQLQGQSAATQSNAQTAGTAFTGAANSGYQQALQQYIGASTALQQAEGQSQNLITSINGVNGLSSQYANRTVNALKNQFGDANYTAFITALSEAQQAYTQLLASTGASTPTVNGQQATAILNPNSTPAQIQAALNSLHQAASAKIAPLAGQVNAYGQNLGIGGGSVSSGNQGGGGATVHTSAGAVNTNW